MLPKLAIRDEIGIRDPFVTDEVRSPVTRDYRNRTVTASPNYAQLHGRADFFIGRALPVPINS